MKKLFTLFLALVASVGTMFASNTQMGGIWYDFDRSSKTATVTYRGSSYHSYSNEYTGDIVIPASVTDNGLTYSVTSIGESAFRDCTGLTSVTIPNSVTSIGTQAFDGCSSLPVTDNIRYAGTYLVKVVDKTQSSYTIQEGTKWIGHNAFQDCNTMTSVTIPNSVTSIGSRAFWKCTGLTSVTIPNSVTSIRGSAFSGCTSLTSVTIPNSVTSIGSGAFSSCSSLTSVTIPNSVTSIGDWAFQYCSSLTSINIPNSVTSIGKEAFYKCSSLTSVTIGNSVKSIGDNAFWKCTGLTSVTINSQYIVGKTYTSSSNIKNIFGSQVTQYVIGNSVTSIGDWAFYGCTGLTGEFVIPNSVTSIGSGAFSHCSGLTGEFVIPNSVTSIEDYAFSGCTGLTSVSIPNSVTSIGGCAFSGCTGLTGEFVIPNSVTSIGKEAFYNCSGLTSVTIGNSVTSIGDETFYNCTGMTSVTIGNSVTSIGKEAFYNCSSLTSVTINSPDIVGKTYTSSSNIKKIFGSQVTQYIIGNSVTSIGDYAFYECSSLTSVTIGNSVTSIGNHVFTGCVGLTSVIWNAKKYSGLALDDTPFYGDSYVDEFFQLSKIDLRPQITSFTFGNEVEHIPAFLCSGMSNLTSVTIGNSVKSIGSSAFYDCTSLTSVHISDLAAWCAISFSSNPLNYAHNLYLNGELVTDLVIPDSVTSIGGSAFSGCTGLTSVTIPNSVTSIGSSAFRGCTGLTSVTIPNSVTSIGDETFYNCTGLTSVTIGNSVTSIGDETFYNCTGLTTMTIPDSVTSIGGSAFSGCTGLTSVTIGNSVTSIGSDAFYNCSSLTSITINSPDIVGKTYTSSSNIKNIFGSQVTQYIIGNNVTSIGNWAFSYCTGMTSVTIGNSVTSIGNYAFSGCRGLTGEVVIPNSVTSIGGGAFYGCYGLTSVTIGNSVTSIGSDAFYYCSGLTSVTIGNSVTSIGNWAFRGCTGLTSVTIEAETPPTWGDAFSITNDCPIYVPCNAVNAYKAAWSKYADRIYGNCASSYTVRFLNWDGSVLQSTQVEEGKMPQYTGATPTRPDDSQYTYTFSGWTPQIVAATADATYTATFTATEIPSEECTDVNDTWLQTGGGGLGEMTTDYSGVWFYDAQYGAKASKQGGYTGYLMTPAKDLRGMKSVTLSFMHTHKFAGTPSNELTLWVTPDYKGSVETSQWQQLTIAPYAANTNWTFVSVSINVPVSKVGANTVFAFKYMSTASNYATWEIQNLTLIAECEGSTPPQPTSYTIKFKNWDGSVLQSKQVEEGQMPQYTGTTPTKPDDAQYTYTFSGWTPQIVAATADATYTATFTATEIPSEECGVNATWLQTGGSGLGEITTDNSGVWKYEYQYGACAKANSGETGWLLTPAKDLRGMKSVNLSFLHVHKYAGTFTNDMTLWVCANYKGSVSASQWQQLTISPYSTNNNWTFVSVSINVPLNMVGANTVFGFKYISSTSSAKWQIKELNLNAECAKADETTTTDVTATPNEDNSVTLTWPAVNGADTYTIEIKKNGVLVCTLVFNANGQLISINFAAPARDGKGRNVPAAEQSANGWMYVVTGLEGNASYTYTVTAKDVNGNVLLKQSVDFSTGEEQGIEDIPSSSLQGGDRGRLILRNGQVLILRNGKTYTMQGQEVK